MPQLVIVVWKIIAHNAPCSIQIVSAIRRVSHYSARPPVLILHGLWDSIIPITQAQSFRDAMQSVGQKYRYIEVPDAGHLLAFLLTSPWSQRHRSDILQFLGGHLSLN